MMLFILSVIALILLMWFRTDAWVEYCKLFKLDSLSFYKDYDEKYSRDVSLTYHSYLRRYHNCFFVRLITCPICLAIWLGIIAFFFQSFVMVSCGYDIVYSISSIIRYGFQLPIEILGGISVFAAIDRLLG